MEKVTTSLRVLIPDATRNYIQNPAIRQDTTGWTASGSAISRATSRARFGFSSLQVVTTGAAVNEGAYYRVNALSAYDAACTVSAYVRGDGEVRIRLISSGGKQWYSKTVDVTDERWTRIEITGRCQKTDDVRLYVETDGDAAQSVTFYVDGAQMELHPYSTTYCDGEQDGCNWVSNFDSSESIRPEYTRLGGKWIPITGPLREDDDNIYMTLVTGAGMAPMDVNSQSYATRPGGYFDNTKVRERVLQLTFFTKDSSGESASIQRLHHLKQELIDIFKPDRTYGDEPIRLEYTVADNPSFYIEVRYDGGLDGAWDVRNKWSNGFVLRLTAVDPFWYEDTQEITELDPSDTQNDSAVGLPVKSVEDGSWSFIPVVGNGDLYGVAQDPSNGTLYFMFYTGVPGNGDIWSWDGTDAVKIGTVNAGAPQDIAVDRNGRVYVGGDTLQIDAVVQNLIYYESGAWTGIATPDGGSAAIATMVLDVEGNLYTAGTFIGGTWPIAKYDGTWTSPGNASGASFAIAGAVRIIGISYDRRYLYVMGDFTITYPSGDTAYGILKYDIRNDEFVDEVSSLNGIATTSIGQNFLITPDNRLFASDASIRYFNGGTWSSIAVPSSSSSFGTSGFNGYIYYRGGVLSSKNPGVGGEGYFLSLLRSSVYAELDFWSSSQINTPFADKNGNLYIGAPTGSYGVTNEVENIGSAFVEPQLYIKNQGTLKVIGNITQDLYVYFDLTSLSNEELVVDFGTNEVTSNIRGNLSSDISYLSEMSAFALMPKNNLINLFIHNTYGIEVRMAYVPRHWSVDAVARKEAI